MSKFTNILLAILIAIASVMLVRANHRGAELKGEYDRLAEKYGTLPVEDENQFMVVFVSGEEPRQRFTWRIFAPALPNGLGEVVYSTSGKSASYGFEKNAREIRVFARFRVRDGTPELYYSVAGSASVERFDPSIHAFVAAHWNDLDFEILGELEPAESPANKVQKLVSIRIPEHLHNKLPDDLSERKRKKLTTTPLVEIFIGDHKLLEQL